MNALVEAILQGWWRFAIVLVPITFVAAMALRVIPSRAATRHIVFVLLLGLLLIGPAIPAIAPLPAIVTDNPDPTSPIDNLDAGDAPGSTADTEPSVAGWVAPTTPAPPISAPRTAQRNRAMHPARPAVRADQAVSFIPPARTDDSAAQPRTAPMRIALEPLAFDPALPSPDDFAAPDPQPAAAMYASQQWTREFVAALAAIRDAVVHIPPLPALIWIGGGLFTLLIVLTRIENARRIVRRGRLAPIELEQTVEHAASTIGLRRAPCVVLTDAEVSPLVWCGRKPTLVLPAQLMRDLDDSATLAVITHELAHLRRRDHWVCRGQLLVALIYWWHPLVWWLRSRIREEADLCCDAWVTLLQPRARRDYALALLHSKTTIGRGRGSMLEPSVGLGVVGQDRTTRRKKNFARRLNMVMSNPAQPRMSRRGTASVGILALGALIAAPLLACPPEKAEKPCKPEAPEAPTATMPEPPEAPPAPSIFSVPAEPEDESTYQRYLRERDAPRLDATAPMQDRLREMEERMHKMHKMMEEVMSEYQGTGVYFATPPAPAATPGTGKCGQTGPTARVSVPGRLNAPTINRVVPRPALRTAVPGIVAYAPPDVGTGIRVRPGASKIVVDCDEVFEKTYSISDGKQEALYDLMARADVPILISQSSNGITVHATYPQHQVFEAFTLMIGSDNTDQETTPMPRGQRDAMWTLMARDDVPVLVSQDDDGITVHGTDLEQAIFQAFADMIHPDAESRADTPSRGMGLSREADARRAMERVLNLERQQRDRRAAAEGRDHDALTREYAARARDMAQHRRDHESQIRELRQHMRQVEREQQRIEREAEKHDREADRLGDRVDTLRDRLDRTDNPSKRDALQVEIDTLRARAAEFEAAAKALENQAEALDDAVDDIEDASEDLAERMEELQEEYEDAIDDDDSENDDRKGRGRGRGR